MPLQIIRQDITKLECDAIVNASNSALSPGGGVDAAIHAAAGPKLAAACRKLGGCPTGEVRLTKGYRLPCNYVIHTAGPVWQGGGHGEQALLEACYRNALELAERKGCKSVAFPLISAGAFGFPRDLALRTAVNCIGAFLSEREMLVYLVVFGREEFLTGSRLFADIRSYIDENYVAARRDDFSQRHSFMGKWPDSGGKTFSLEDTAPSWLEDTAELPDFDAMPPLAGTAPFAPPKGAPRPRAKAAAKTVAAMAEPASLRDALRQLDESFQQMLFRKIDEKGMTDAQCYKKANIDRKLFSKLRKDVHYRPSKPTAIAFAIALELPLPEARELLMKAGYALSHSSEFDIIIEYFIQKGNYNIFEINEALFAFDQSLLGAG